VAQSGLIVVFKGVCVIAQEMIATCCLFSDAVDHFSSSEDIA
jgi:hypothetical protein